MHLLAAALPAALPGRPPGTGTLDVVVLLAALVFAASGFRRGVVVGLLSLAGFVLGGVGGMILAPEVVSSREPGVSTTVVAVVIVVGAAMLGRIVLTFVGLRVRARLTWRPARLVDALLGAAVGALAVLVVAWLLASPLRQGPSPSVSRAVRDSRVITAVDRVMPDAARGLFGSFRSLVARGGFPQVFGGLAPERIRPVEPPGRGVVASRGVAAAARSVVKIVGDAGACRREVEGSGFVYARGHVLTNAHVVAGVSSPVVRVGGTGPALPGRVVVFDSHRDLAVLAVPGLSAPALRLDDDAGRGDPAVVAGFPRGGPYRLEAARVRERITARGPDIYDRTQVTRRVLSLYTTVQPGNSGGPLLSPDGTVYGVVFAKSMDDDRTGYALTTDEARPVARAGQDATVPVDTGDCAD